MYVCVCGGGEADTEPQKSKTWASFNVLHDTNFKLQLN